MLRLRRHLFDTARQRLRLCITSQIVSNTVVCAPFGVAQQVGEGLEADVAARRQRYLLLRKHFYLVAHHVDPPATAASPLSPI